MAAACGGRAGLQLGRAAVKQSLDFLRLAAQPARLVQCQVAGLYSRGRAPGVERRPHLAQQRQQHATADSDVLQHIESVLGPLDTAPLVRDAAGSRGGT